MRTRKNPNEIRKILQQMIDVNLVEYLAINKTYRAKTIHQVVTEVGSSQFFKHFYLKSIKELQKQASNHFISDEKLFLQTSFSVSSTEKLKQLKAIQVKDIEIFDREKYACKTFMKAISNEPFSLTEWKGGSVHSKVIFEIIENIFVHLSF